MIKQIEGVFRYCYNNSEDVSKGIALCADWADLIFEESFPEAGRNLFQYIFCGESFCGWRDFVQQVGETKILFEEGKWGWKEGSLAILKIIYSTAAYTIIGFRHALKIEIKYLPAVEWIGDTAHVLLKVEGAWTKWGKSAGCFDTCESVGSGLSAVFSIVKLFESDAKKSVVLAWMDVTLSTALFVAGLFLKPKNQSRQKNEPE